MIFMRYYMIMLVSCYETYIIPSHPNHWNMFHLPTSGSAWQLRSDYKAPGQARARKTGGI